MEQNPKLLIEQAERCRRLASQLSDSELAQRLLTLGEEYAQRAGQSLRPGKRQRQPRPISTAH
jgi:hypothetical protein